MQPMHQLHKATHHLGQSESKTTRSESGPMVREKPWFVIQASGLHQILILPWKCCLIPLYLRVSHRMDWHSTIFLPDIKRINTFLTWMSVDAWNSGMNVKPGL